MADIVIKLPDNFLKGMKIENGSLACQRILDAVYNGVPLPKGHGKLIDADDVKSYFSDREGDDFTAFHFYDAVESAQTIIEADKEQEE